MLINEKNLIIRKLFHQNVNVPSISNLSNLPVVSAGVHSCSPVAPHSRVFFKGVVLTDAAAVVAVDANVEFKTETFLFGPTVRSKK